MPRLQGYRLKVWHYLPIAAETDGSLVSTALGLRLKLADGLLEVYDAESGVRLLRTDETAAARLAAEREMDRERRARLAAEREVDRERSQRLAAEAEALRMREELARLRGEGDP